MKLFTIGYEGRTAPELARILQESGVARVIDVRLTPRSRIKGLSLMALFERFRKAGIVYEHRAGLGNPLEIRALFMDGRLSEGRRRFRARMENGHAGDVDVMLGLARVAPTAIMCREADVYDCHRLVLAHLAEERGFSVVHL